MSRSTTVIWRIWPRHWADLTIAVNVLEHVERDEEFLRASYEILAPGGALLLLVPAVPAIFGSLDRAFDHFRRYTPSGLRTSLLATGFEIETLHYLNMVGVAAWFVSGRILRRTTLGRGQVRFYDRWIIPFVRRLESVVTPPIGQSILVMARKPAGATSESFTRWGRQSVPDEARSASLAHLSFLRLAYCQPGRRALRADDRASGVRADLG